MGQNLGKKKSFNAHDETDLQHSKNQNNPAMELSYPIPIPRTKGKGSKKTSQYLSVDDALSKDREIALGKKKFGSIKKGIKIQNTKNINSNKAGSSSGDFDVKIRLYPEENSKFMEINNVSRKSSVPGQLMKEEVTGPSSKNVKTSTSLETVAAGTTGITETTEIPNNMFEDPSIAKNVNVNSKSFTSQNQSNLPMSDLKTKNNPSPNIQKTTQSVNKTNAQQEIQYPGKNKPKFNSKESMDINVMKSSKNAASKASGPEPMGVKLPESPLLQKSSLMDGSSMTQGMPKSKTQQDVKEKSIELLKGTSSLTKKENSDETFLSRNNSPFEKSDTLLGQDSSINKAISAPASTMTMMPTTTEPTLFDKSNEKASELQKKSETSSDSPLTSPRLYDNSRKSTAEPIKNSEVKALDKKEDNSVLLKNKASQQQKSPTTFNNGSRSSPNDSITPTKTQPSTAKAVSWTKPASLNLGTDNENISPLLGASGKQTDTAPGHLKNVKTLNSPSHWSAKSSRSSSVSTLQSSNVSGKRNATKASPPKKGQMPPPATQPQRYILPLNTTKNFSKSQRRMSSIDSSESDNLYQRFSQESKMTSHSKKPHAGYTSPSLGRMSFPRGSRSFVRDRHFDSTTHLADSTRTPSGRHRVKRKSKKSGEKKPERNGPPPYPQPTRELTICERFSCSCHLPDHAIDKCPTCRLVTFDDCPLL